MSTWAFGPAPVDPANAPGSLVAHRLSDGSVLWNKTVPRPPNNLAAIGRLFGREGLSVVQPVGQQVLQGAQTDLLALDAETGEVQWLFEGPKQSGVLQARELGLGFFH